MARTLATNDTVWWGNTYDITGGPYTIAFRHTPDALGSLQRWVSISNTDVNNFGPQIIDPGSGQYQHFLPCSTTNQTWVTAAQSAAERHVAVTWDGTVGDYANDGDIYLDGSVATGGGSNGAGTVIAANGRHAVGSHFNTAADYGPGEYADYAIWDRQLSADDIAALAEGYTPNHFPRGLRFWAPLYRETTDIIGNVAASLSDGSVANHYIKHIPRSTPTIISAPAAVSGLSAGGLALMGVGI